LTRLRSRRSSTAEGEQFAHGLAENLAAQVLALVANSASNYSHVLFPATAAGKNVAPGVAARLDVGQMASFLVGWVGSPV
jgi:electron transfer flavoprotein alpha subunit